MNTLIRKSTHQILCTLIAIQKSTNAATSLFSLLHVQCSKIVTKFYERTTNVLFQLDAQCTRNKSQLNAHKNNNKKACTISQHTIGHLLWLATLLCVPVIRVRNNNNKQQTAVLRALSYSILKCHVGLVIFLLLLFLSSLLFCLFILKMRCHLRFVVAVAVTVAVDTAAVFFSSQ